MTRINRRNFGSLVGASAVGLSLAPLTNLFEPGKARAAGGNPGFGPLEPKLPTNMTELPAHLQDKAFMTLPHPFNYSVVSYRDQVMRDGNAVPGAADGMAAFGSSRGNIILVRNHELSTGGTPVIAPAGSTYDPQVRGGTTNVLVDNMTARSRSSHRTSGAAPSGPVPASRPPATLCS